ncbi:MAG: hypothetical protein ACRESP_14910, partial [Pseudomonas sp.]
IKQMPCQLLRILVNQGLAGNQGELAGTKKPGFRYLKTRLLLREINAVTKRCNPPTPLYP